MKFLTYLGTNPGTQKEREVIRVVVDSDYCTKVNCRCINTNLVFQSIFCMSRMKDNGYCLVMVAEKWHSCTAIFMKMMKEEVVKSMFIIHSKNEDNKEQEAIEFKETYDFDILLRRFRMN